MSGDIVVTINDIMPARLLGEMITAGYVRTQTHPTLPYVIHNYTEKAAYENVWNDVTLQCRGLIVNADTGAIIARPFKKFFNYMQRGAPAITQPNSPVSVTDKADGSLGIMYPVPKEMGSCAIATRGSFTSAQAQHATQLFRRKYATRWAPQRIPWVLDGEHSDFTYLFEIIYPENRIVLNYGDTDDLMLLGAVSNASGRSVPADVMADWSRWPGPIVKTFTHNTLSSALSAPPRENAEGLVVHFIYSDERVKIKQDDYVALHRVLTNTTARSVWQYLAVNACKELIKQPKHWGSRLGIDPKRAEEILAVGDDWTDQLVAGVPDEFYAWLKRTINQLEDAYAKMRHEIKHAYYSYLGVATKDRPFDRKIFWELTAHESSQERRGMIMALLEEKDITTQIWRHIYPDVELPFKQVAEDNA